MPLPPPASPVVDALVGGTATASVVAKEAKGFRLLPLDDEAVGLLKSLANASSTGRGEGVDADDGVELAGGGGSTGGAGLNDRYFFLIDC